MKWFSASMRTPPAPKAAERSLDALLENDLIVRVVEMPPGEDPDSLVRREGKEQFEKRVANARDFFDYWIEREIASVDLDFDGRKNSSRAQSGGDGVASARSAPAGRGGQQSIGAPRCCACRFRITSGKARSRARWFAWTRAQLKLVPRRVHRMIL